MSLSSYFAIGVVLAVAMALTLLAARRWRFSKEQRRIQEIYQNPWRPYSSNFSRREWSHLNKASRHHYSKSNKAGDTPSVIHTNSNNNSSNSISSNNNINNGSLNNSNSIDTSTIRGNTSTLRPDSISSGLDIPMVKITYTSDTTLVAGSASTTASVPLSAQATTATTTAATRSLNSPEVRPNNLHHNHHYSQNSKRREKKPVVFAWPPLPAPTLQTERTAGVTASATTAHRLLNDAPSQFILRDPRPDDLNTPSQIVESDSQWTSMQQDEKLSTPSFTPAHQTWRHL